MVSLNFVADLGFLDEQILFGYFYTVVRLNLGFSFIFKIQQFVVYFFFISSNAIRKAHTHALRYLVCLSNKSINNFMFLFIN